MDGVFQKALCRTNFCCCGCPVKEGTLVLLVLNAIFYAEILVQCLTHNSIGNILETNGRIFLVMLVILFLFSKIAGIYGMFKKIPALLIPQMITQVILMVLYGCTVLSMIFNRQAVIRWIKKEVPSLIHEHIAAIADKIFFFLCVLFILLIALQYHLYTVVLSYFFKLKQEINYPERVQMKMITV